MLNYDIATGESRHQIDDDSTATFDEVELLDNPFPGLRPFNIDENHLFFGREGQVDEILTKLSNNKFVTVIGYSGSGKSSLMHCGLLPALYGGFMKHAGSNWKIITARPGINPFYNLAEAILKQRNDYDQLPESEKAVSTTVISSILKSSPGGFIEAIKYFKQDSDVNLLLVVDQFEEIFRYADMEGSSSYHEEAIAYVQMILKSTEQTEFPIYTALTLRSDFIGRCANFQGLTDKINESNYLVPQMLREQKKLVVEGPVAVGGGKISTRLVKKLLNDISDHQDQLPILQHVMMRTWDYWLENHEQGEPIDLRHYQAVGGISEALSQHADEAYDQLNPRQKEIAEILFKTLTVRTTENQGIRRAAKISVIAEISGASEEEVIEVIEEFRKPGRSFLMPAPGVKLKADTNIEISHESLMRIWTRLKAWVDEEYESAQMYKRLSEAAAMYQIGKTGLWRPPDLQLALNWQKKQRPTRAWAQRYDEAFERAIVFLDTSRITYEAEQKNQEMVQKRLLRRTRFVAVVLGAAAVVSILFLVYAVTQQFKAQKAAGEMQIARDLMEEQKLLAEQNAEEAERAKDLAQKRSESLAIAYEDLKVLNDKLADSTQVLAQQRANLQQLLFNLQLAQQEVQKEAQNAQAQTILAKANEAKAQTNYQRASTLLGISVAQTMAVKSQFIDDVDLRSAVAQQAYNFHSSNDGRVNDPYIYNALHNAVDLQNGGNYNTYQLSSDPIRSAQYGRNSIYATGSDGKLFKIDRNNLNNETLLLENNYPNKFVRLSPDEKWLIIATDSSFMQILPADGGEINYMKGHGGFVYDVAFLPASSSFYSIGYDSVIRINNPANRESTFFKKLNYPAKSIALNSEGDLMVLGTEDSRVFLLDMQTKKDELIISKGKNNPAHTVAFHPNGKLIAVGYEKGMVDIFNLRIGEIVKELHGHKSKVSKVAFSSDSKYLATGSFDKTIYLWTMDELDELPTILEDHEGFVWDLDFSKDNNFLVASVGSGNIKLWPLRPELMADNICQMIFRNMTADEWRIYVGTEIEYERTCANLPDVF